MLEQAREPLSREEMKETLGQLEERLELLGRRL